MARVIPLPKEEASPEAKEIYRDVEACFGMIPNLFLTIGHYPPLLKTSWESVKAIMLNQGALSRRVKETIAVLVSRDNACRYCVNAHSMMLKAIGVTDAELENIHSNSLDQANNDRDKISGRGRAAASTLQVHRALMEHPITTSGWLVEKTGITPATVNKTLSHLEQVGIVQELTAQKRNRLSSYAGYIEIMSRGTELPGG